MDFPWVKTGGDRDPKGYAVSAGAFFFGFFQKKLKKMAFWQNFLIIFGAFGRLSKYFAKFGKKFSNFGRYYVKY